MKTSLLTRRGRGRRRLLLGATTLAVGLVVSTQSSQVAALGGTADPDGPVGTADTASGLLSGLLGRGLTGTTSSPTRPASTPRTAAATG